MSDNIYGADNIKVLEGLEAVRKRPSMYIGNTDVEGLHHLVYEIVDNSIDEAMAGYCDTIRVVIHPDNSVSVEDNGRGIPVELHKQEGVPALEVVMTKLHAGGKFDNDSYKVSGGLHGVGVSVVNALSSVLEVEVFREGSVYYQRYEKGIKASELKVVGLTTKRGTKIHFVPDGEILTTTTFVFDILSRRCRELAFLNKGIRITIEDERTEAKNDFFYEGGISEFVQYLNRHNTPLHEPILIAGDRSDTQIEVAIQYNDTFTEKLFSFANNINTIEGGFHLIGFKAALTRTINQYATNGTLPKDFKSKISGEDVREGLTAVISVKIRSPQFEGQTKTKLGNSEVKGQVESLINEKLGIFFEENPAVLKKIIAKSAEAARARDAAKRARELVRSKGSLMDSTLPGKLADCQVSEPEAREIFIVEGDSAGGCFSGDTKVACTDGRNLSFIQLIEEANQGRQNFCYTILPDGSIGIEKILHPRCTKKNAQVVKIVLDNEEEIVCTPDHLFMRRDGAYIQAKNLANNDSLMPFYSKEFIKKENLVPHNHKIRRIEFLSETIDVYDIEVPNTHNFALASGVFVHNSAKQGRDRRFQAILPLKGKILNVEKARFDKILRSDEIRNIITALGTGVGDEEYDIEKIRYHKNIIMSVSGDEPTLIADETGQTEFTEIGRFIDECMSGIRKMSRYKVISFDPIAYSTRFNPLKAVIRHAHTEPMYNILTRYNRSVKVTSSHSVYVFDNGKVCLKKGNEVRPGDMLVAPRRLPRPAQSPARIDLLKTFYQANLTHALYVKGEDVRRVAGLRLLAKVSRPDQWKEPRVKLKSDAWKELVIQRQSVGISQKQAAAVCGAKQPITVSHWERGINRPTLPEFINYVHAIGGNENVAYELYPSKLERCLSQSDSSKNARWREVSFYKRLENFTSEEISELGEDIEIVPQAYQNKAFSRYLPVTRELLWFMGWYLAEGTLSQHQVSLNIGKKDEPFIPELCAAVETVFKEKPRCYYDPHSEAIKLYFHSVSAARLIQAYGMAELSHEKKLPGIVFSLSEDLQMAFLEGYFLGDGTTVGKDFSFTTNSRQIKDGLLYLCAQQGLIASSSYLMPSTPETASIQTRHPYYIITIGGRDQIERCRPIWKRHANSPKTEVYLKQTRKKRPEYLPIGEDLIGLKVVSAEEIEPVGEYVYDFSVEGDENFICGTGGLCAKNTDADVDGSHIRTLLLTFFYRHMKEVIERGYLYIAQPPLFKVTRGKSEMYLKHETDLSEYILKRVCDQKAIKNANGETISDHALYLFAGDLAEYLVLTEKSEQRGIPASLIEFLIRQGVENKQFLQNQEKMSGVKSLLIEKGYTIEEFSWSEEREIYRMRVIPPTSDSSDKAEPVKIGRLIFSQDYQKCLDLAKRIFPFDYPPYAMFGKDKEGEFSSAENLRALWNLLIEEGKKGVGVQRYKGLGEMNPDQLWDTTMNPETRTLLKVKIEDAVEADAIFSLLMGDVVEPRREFIQNNALEVSTLDI